MSQVTKREVPASLKTVLDVDVKYTKKFVVWANNFLPYTTCRKYYKGLEISCHGIPWFAFWICFTWLFNNVSLIPMQVNMLIGLFIDIVLVALVKAYTRRRRPRLNTDDALGQIGPDVFSFPSGHASRAVYVAYFFVNLYALPMIFVPFVLVWATCVCFSRLLLNRHHILDVAGGVFLGLVEGWILGFLWLEDDTAKSIMNMLSDEKLDGGEFHV